MRETKCQLLHGTGSFHLTVARGSSGAGRYSHDRQSQRRQSKWTSKNKIKNATFSTFADDNIDKKTGQDSLLEDGKHTL